MFSFFSRKYSRVREYNALEEDRETVERRPSKSAQLLLTPCLLILLAISVASNIWVHAKRDNVCSGCISDFAHLERVLPLPFVTEGRENTIPDAEWDFQNSDTGLVALTDEYVAGMDLPRAQRFPWDESKGIYFLHGHHNLHCLKLLRNSILEYRNHSKQTNHWLHVDHCLTALREDILCNADDTPRYTGGGHRQPGSGQGQVRLCRDWSKLDQWATANSACFQTPSSWYDGKEMEERYKSCPDGSRPWEDMEKNG